MLSLPPYEFPGEKTPPRFCQDSDHVSSVYTEPEPISWEDPAPTLIPVFSLTPVRVKEEDIECKSEEPPQIEFDLDIPDFTY